ncbi:hypothetical protein EDC04DRAFT_2643476 [Pisolithus marmoratus]|nr:hypothetical protein EDC04DRAFT_2643476 [Pisolithus marmoratus]
MPPPIASNDDAPGSALVAQKFPHTRAQLSAIYRQHKGGLLEGYEYNNDGDESARISTSVVMEVVALLGDEQEDKLKELLQTNFGVHDSDMLEQHVLDLMHRHRDDVAGVPFLYLTPTRRPISRPSSRASSHSTRLNSNRPDTPTSLPNSPLPNSFRRPHTPVTSPLVSGNASSYVTARSVSPMHSPVLAHAQSHAQFAASLPSSPISSPRLLSAKATEFKPIQRPLSAASSNPATLSGYRTETPSPDLWSHSPLRATSNLAIAAPLLPEHPRAVTPSSLRSSLKPGEDEDEDDPFDPFASKSGPQSFLPVTITDVDQWSDTAPSNSSLSPEGAQQGYYPLDYNQDMPYGNEVDDPDAVAFLTDGMTPLDVLSSVFGSTLAPSELEEALSQNGYDFEKAMAWLVDRSLPPLSQPTQPRVQHVGNRIALITRDGPVANVRDGRGHQTPARATGRGTCARGAPPTNNRVCRYYLAGECLRADCRFSHDLERALCRFWLRGTCAKQDQCEFLHQLPDNVEVASATNALARTNFGSNNGNSYPGTSSPPAEDFPALGYDGTSASRNRKGYGARDGHWQNDPGRTRFAAAVKRQVPTTAPPDRAMVTRRESMTNINTADNLPLRTTIVAPKPSPRIKLRPPTLLPTLAMGDAVNDLYMTYRSRALQLGAARNACLSRAADAWRRGDGAAAKRFSREGHELNAKMGHEMAEAAGKLVRERAKLAEKAVKARELNWSDDLGDRSIRGRTCGGGLGICLGVAKKDIGGEAKLSSEERTEVMLDLHGLHSNEAAEVLEEFLLALEREHFLGLAFAIVGEEKHTGMQNPLRGVSRARLSAGVREWLHRWGYPWNERDGVICIDPLTHS